MQKLKVAEPKSVISYDDQTNYQKHDLPSYFVCQVNTMPFSLCRIGNQNDWWLNCAHLDIRDRRVNGKGRSLEEVQKAIENILAGEARRQRDFLDATLKVMGYRKRTPKGEL